MFCTAEYSVLLNVLYSSPNIVGVTIEKNELGGTCSAYGGEERRI